MTGDFPQYSYPGGMVAGLAFDFLFQRAHSFREGWAGVHGTAKAGTTSSGERKHSAKRAHVILTFNHYYRAGFNAWWMALALAATVPVEIHFVMTGELTFPGKWYAPLGMAGSRWLLKRFSHIYGFTTHAAHAAAATGCEGARPVCAACAGICQGASTGHPWPGSGGRRPARRIAQLAAGRRGTFILLLAEQGFPILPVGCFEEAGAFCLHFGEAYQLKIPDGLTSKEKDSAAAGSVMQKIAPLLPERLRGEFA